MVDTIAAAVAAATQSSEKDKAKETSEASTIKLITKSLRTVCSRLSPQPALRSTSSSSFRFSFSAVRQWWDTINACRRLESV